MKPSAEALVLLENVTVDFPVRGGLPWQREMMRAVDSVSFVIRPGQAFGLVGESGSGKSTLGRCILGLLEPTSGDIFVAGESLSALRKRPDELHRTIQAVFQNPIGSLNPMMTVAEILAEPLRRLVGLRDRKELTQRVNQLLDEVRLPSTIATQRPRQLSGGQAQRVSIARALAPKPSVIVLDEAVSALDVATQAQIVNLLGDLRDELNVSYLFIAHDLAVVHHLCDEIAVLEHGHLVELGDRTQVCHHPTHDYTKRLVDAIPVADPTVRRIRAAAL